MPKGPVRGQRIKNPAKKGGVTAAQANAIAASQIHLSNFQTDYYQLVLRVSTAVDGLRFGSVPPIVT